MRAFFSLLSILCLAGCGFQLRGEAQLPFQHLHVLGAQNSPLTHDLKRAIVAGTNTRLAPMPEADAELAILSEVREKIILSLNSAGKVREYELRLRVAFRLTDSKNRELIPRNEIALNRVISFNDEQVLAKEAEEALLYRDMQNDAVQQIIRRLAAVKLPA